MRLRIRIVILIVLLKDGRLVASTSANSVVITHDVPQLIEVLKYMNAYASIEAGWF